MNVAYFFAFGRILFVVEINFEKNNIVFTVLIECVEDVLLAVSLEEFVIIGYEADFRIGDSDGSVSAS